MRTESDEGQMRKVSGGERDGACWLMLQAETHMKSSLDSATTRWTNRRQKQRVHLSWGHRGQCLHRRWDTRPRPPAGRLLTVGEETRVGERACSGAGLIQHVEELRNPGTCRGLSPGRRPPLVFSSERGRKEEEEEEH